MWLVDFFKKPRKKLSAKIFTIIISSLLAVLLTFAIVLPCVSIGVYDLVLRDFFGTAGKAGTTGGNEITDKLDKEYNKLSDKTGMTAEKLDEYEKNLVRASGAEGYVLLKNENNALPFTDKTKTIHMFSHSSVDLLAGGTGSGESYTTSNLKDAFKAEEFKINETLWDFYNNSGTKYKRGAGAISFGGDEDWSLNECPKNEIPDNALSSVKRDDYAIFVFSRTGGEGRDLARHMGKFAATEGDKIKHYLEPDSVELGVIDYLDKTFDNVVIVVNTNNAFELDWIKDYNNIKSVLWAPGGGGETATSIVDVLVGNVNPSGRLVDTFARDALSSPAMKNMGDIRFTVGGEATNYYGVSYDEGIYVGYKYYETRYFDKVKNQGNAGNYDYDAVVQYPFGYGTSYTDFTWSGFEFTQPDNNGEMTVKVTVTNAANGKAGKEVVQVYMNPEYTKYDQDNYLEKSAVNLVGFKKTGVIEPGGHETVEIKINLRDFISYDEVGFKTYILEAGDYLVTAAKDAHEANKNFLKKGGVTTVGGDDTFVGVYNQAETDTTTYAKSSNNKDVTNVFGKDGNGGKSASWIERSQYLSRRDWVSTFPKGQGTVSNVDSGFSEIGGKTRHWEVSQQVINWFKAQDTAEAANTPLSDADAAKLAKPYNQQGELQLIELRGASYDDPRWEKLIQQMSPSEVGSIIGKAGYTTLAANSVYKPKAIDLDGPSGLNNMVGHAAYSITYPAEVNIAASWSNQIAYDWGEAVGMDGLRSNVDCSGWYAPAMNIHRTPFAGRNFEYFSEDSFISGVLATDAIQGAASMGMYSYIKHFALNDQEDHRCDGGLATFSNEQAIREIYLKPFQMAIENSGNVTLKYYDHTVDAEGKDVYTAKTADVPIATAVMSSFNRIGYTWAGGDYRLITQILRDEWGFKGAVLTDYNSQSYMTEDQFLRAGGDLSLTQYGMAYRINNDTKVYYTQQAMKHTLYMVANSNAMNGYVYGIQFGGEPFAWYYLILIAVDLVAAGLTAWGVTAIVFRWRKELRAKAQDASAEPDLSDGSVPETDNTDNNTETE